jgi:hypothetical protein
MFTGAWMSPFRDLRFSSRTRSRISGRWAMIWKSHVAALLVASWEANKKVKTVCEIS